MKPLPKLELTPRARRDLGRQVAFIARQPWGEPADRRRDIGTAFQNIRRTPFARPVRKRVRGTNLELRCYNVSQFVVVVSAETSRMVGGAEGAYQT